MSISDPLRCLNFVFPSRQLFRKYSNEIFSRFQMSYSVICWDLSSFYFFENIGILRDFLFHFLFPTIFIFRTKIAKKSRFNIEIFQIYDREKSQKNPKKPSKATSASLSLFQTFCQGIVLKRRTLC